MHILNSRRSQIYLCRFEHKLGRIVKEGQRAFGEAMGTHQHSRKLDISLPRVHHLLGSEALEINQKKIHKSLNKCEVPPITAPKEKAKIGGISMKQKTRLAYEISWVISIFGKGSPELQLVIYIFLKKLGTKWRSNQLWKVCM